MTTTTTQPNAESSTTPDVTPAYPIDPTPTPAVQLEGLTHRYPGGERAAIDGLSLSIRPGEAFAFLGPNGGGKTTTFRILATLLSPSGGDRVSASSKAGARVFGHDVGRDPAAARRMMGVVFQSPSLDIKLTARENLLCQAQLYGLTKREAKPRVTEALRQFGLADRSADRVETFSGGMKRKLEIAKALLHGPRLLLMDEPATGLDPAARRDLWQHLEALRGSTALTIAWTTHLMDEAEHADRLAVLAEGRLLALDQPQNLKAAAGLSVVTLEPMEPGELTSLRDRIDAELGPWPSERAKPALIEDGVRFEHADGPAVAPRVASLSPGGLRRISVGQPTLEDAYLRLVAPSTA